MRLVKSIQHAIYCCQERIPKAGVPRETLECNVPLNIVEMGSLTTISSPQEKSFLLS